MEEPIIVYSFEVWDKREAHTSLSGLRVLLGE
jgi:hypothetical protein